MAFVIEVDIVLENDASASALLTNPVLFLVQKPRDGEVRYERPGLNIEFSLTEPSRRKSTPSSPMLQFEHVLTKPSTKKLLKVDA